MNVATENAQFELHPGQATSNTPSHPPVPPVVPQTTLPLYPSYLEAHPSRRSARLKENELLNSFSSLGLNDRVKGSRIARREPVAKPLPARKLSSIQLRAARQIYDKEAKGYSRDESTEELRMVPWHSRSTKDIFVTNRTAELKKTSPFNLSDLQLISYAIDEWDAMRSKGKQGKKLEQKVFKYWEDIRKKEDKKVAEHNHKARLLRLYKNQKASALPSNGQDANGSGPVLPTVPRMDALSTALDGLDMDAPGYEDTTGLVQPSTSDSNQPGRRMDGFLYSPPRGPRRNRPSGSGPPIRPQESRSGRGPLSGQGGNQIGLRRVPTSYQELGRFNSNRPPRILSVTPIRRGPHGEGPSGVSDGHQSALLPISGNGRRDNGPPGHLAGPSSRTPSRAQSAPPATVQDELRAVGNSENGIANQPNQPLAVDGPTPGEQIENEIEMVY